MGFNRSVEPSERHQIFINFRERYVRILETLPKELHRILELKYLWANMAIGQPGEVLDVAERNKYGYLSAQMELQLVNAIPMGGYIDLIDLEGEIALFFRSTDYERDPDPYGQSRAHMNFFFYNETKKYREFTLTDQESEPIQDSNIVNYP